MRSPRPVSWFAVGIGVCALGVIAAGCKGQIGASQGGGGSSPTPAQGTGGSAVEPPPPFEATSDPGTVARKVKNLLTGLVPTDAEVATITSDGAAGLRALITTWTSDPAFRDLYRGKMVGFFRNTFQQTGFTPLEDFKMQLQQNGGFDFGGSTRNLGDDAFARLVQNLQDSFAITAWQLECLIQAQDKLQYLIVSTSSNGDPLNCNVPGTYDGAAADVIHPSQPEMAATALTLGANSYLAAAPWAADASGARYAWLDRTVFFHDLTGSTVHGDQPKVMRLLGATSQGEMMVSAYAKNLAACFGTVQPEPVAVGARGNSSELISYGGRTLPSVSPTQLKQLLTGSKTDPLVRMRTVRDASLDRLNAMVKANGNTVQKKFLDAMAASQAQVRMLADQLATTLAAITADDVNGQALAAAALIAAKVTPVVTMHIAFGGDNHTDQDLQTEADQHVTGVQGIDAVMKALAGLGLTDKVTFATMNVFGRNLNGIDKVSSRAGRDHFGNHNVTIMIGKNIAPGVIGGVVKNSKGTYLASDIDSSTGAAKPGGDIPAAETNIAAAKTLGVALGIPADQLAPSFNASAGGKVVNAALSGVSG